MKIYLIIETSGSYSDITETPIASFNTKEEADAFQKNMVFYDEMLSHYQDIIVNKFNERKKEIKYVGDCIEDRYKEREKTY